jgi:hypothetical protein
MWRVEPKGTDEMNMNKAQWLASRVNGQEIEHDDYVKRKISEPPRHGERVYSAANEWEIMRDPVLSKGAWDWIAERVTKGRVELRGFDQLKHARAWCANAP